MDNFYDVENYVDIYSETNTSFCESRKNCLTSYIRQHNLKLNKVLDLASGTGLFLDLLQKEFNIEKCVGLDFSENMVAYAKKHYKNKHIKFVNGDMTNFNLNERFDLITCNYDAINHLSTFENWVEMFKNVFNNLSEGGIFTFDFNTVENMKNFNGTSYKTLEKYNTIFQLNNKDKRMNFKQIIYNKTPNGFYKMYEVELSESVFPNKAIKKALKQTGFKKIKFCDSDFKNCNTKKAKRLFVLCEK
ncbi:MAG: class I SAM-dependent methyltransferase [Clostridia bacterium]|nr:class I SAM-dependent methyltransferase [Clostridia bacterium]